MYKCINCSYITEYYKELLKHYDYHLNTQNIPCPIDICNGVFLNTRRLKYHLKTKHLIFYNNNCYTRRVNNGINNNSEIDRTSNIITDQLEDDMTINSDLFHEPIPTSSNNQDNIVPNNQNDNTFAAFLVRSRYIDKTSLKTCINFTNEIGSLLESNNDILFNKLKNVVPNEYINKISDIFNTQYLNCINPIKSISSKYSLEKYINNNFNYIKPIEIILGIDINNKNNIYHYVSILDSLKQYIEHDDVLNMIYRERLNDGIIRDFYDSTNYKNNPLFSNTKNAIQIQLYYDEFTCTNPLNNTSKYYKIGACYYILGNLHSKYKSKLNNIQLVFLVKHKHVKKYGLYNIFNNLIKDISILETEGIYITNRGRIIQLFGSISFISSDNLAAHALGGYFENFSSGKRRCRTCMISNEEIKTIFNPKYFNLRSKNGYVNQVNQIELNPELSSEYGLKRDSIFNYLKYFHVSNGLPHDISHDLFEGVVNETLSCVLTKLISDGYLSLVNINDKIISFEYIGNDKNNKPIVLQMYRSKIKIRHTQSQMWCFLRLMPLMFGHLIPYSNNTWELILECINMVESVCAYSFSEGDLSYLELKIELFNKHFCEIFPDVSVKPKRHYITHIPKHIRDFGPVIHSWTIRFEAEHEYYKQIIHRTWNTKNITKTFSEAKQKKQALLSSQSKILQCDTELFHITDIVFTFLPNQIRLLLENMGIHSQLKTVKKCISNGVTYKNGYVIVTSIEYENYVFSIINNIIVIDSIPLLCCKKLISYYCYHYNAYIITETNEYQLLKISDLWDHYPLYLYSINIGQAIVLIHYIPTNRTNKL